MTPKFRVNKKKGGKKRRIVVTISLLHWSYGVEWGQTLCWSWHLTGRKMSASLSVGRLCEPHRASAQKSFRYTKLRSKWPQSLILKYHNLIISSLRTQKHNIFFDHSFHFQTGSCFLNRNYRPTLAANFFKWDASAEHSVVEPFPLQWYIAFKTGKLVSALTRFGFILLKLL